MTFYTYNYITQHSQFNNAVWYVLSFLALAALLFVSIKYLRNRLQPYEERCGGNLACGAVLSHVQ